MPERGWRRCGQRRDSLMAGIWILWKGMMNGSVQLRRRWQSITGAGRRCLVLIKVRRQDPEPWIKGEWLSGTGKGQRSRERGQRTELEVSGARGEGSDKVGEGRDVVRTEP